MRIKWYKTSFFGNCHTVTDVWCVTVMCNWMGVTEESLFGFICLFSNLSDVCITFLSLGWLWVTAMMQLCDGWLMDNCDGWWVTVTYDWISDGWLWCVTKCVTVRTKWCGVLVESLILRLKYSDSTQTLLGLGLHIWLTSVEIWQEWSLSGVQSEVVESERSLIGIGGGQ
jgi:hypothetical protein